MLNVAVASIGNPILQFGTSRFLQAHVDLFVSEALESGQALGRITVVQTTGNAASSTRTAAMAAGEGYPVRLRGLHGGQLVDEIRNCHSIDSALHADMHWPQIQHEVGEGAVQVIVSNTGDTGWNLYTTDERALLGEGASTPRSFPAKLLVLLHRRWQVKPEAPLTVLPCELVTRNGDTLRAIVVELAQHWRLTSAFIDYLQAQVVWGNSLVDRIVSEALDPVGAVAEPYALWAIERQPGLVPPCTHSAIVHTDDLSSYERLKLHLLNLGHTMLAESWLANDRAEARTVLEAMHDDDARCMLEATWSEEVMPVFEALGEGPAAEAYLVTLRDRLSNPFLAHRLADIAQHHAQKKQRRLAPIVAMAARRLPALPQPRLRAALASGL